MTDPFSLAFSFDFPLARCCDSLIGTSSLALLSRIFQFAPFSRSHFGFLTFSESSDFTALTEGSIKKKVRHKFILRTAHLETVFIRFTCDKNQLGKQVGTRPLLGKAAMKLEGEGTSCSATEPCRKIY